MLPILFQNRSFILYSYPLMMGLGWGIGYQIFFHLISKDLSKRQAQFLFWGLFLFSWIGAKLLFYFTLPNHLSENLLTQTSFWTGGGFVFYGGILGSVLFFLFYKGLGFRLCLDDLWPLFPALTLGHAVGRLGCFLAGCCYGSPTDWIWGIFLHGYFRHPTQLLEALGLLILGCYLLKSKASKQHLIAMYFIAYGLLRFFIETFRGDEIRGSWGVLTPSQWISLIFLAVGLVIKFKSKKSVT